MKNSIWSTDIIIFMLTVFCAVLAAIIVLYAPEMALIAVICVVLALFAVGASAVRVRRIIHSVFYGTGRQGALQQMSFENLDVPLCIVSNESMVWYNTAFRTQLLGESDMYLSPIKKLLPDFDVKSAAAKDGMAIKHGTQEYTVYSSNASDDGRLWICYFVNDTKLKFEACEYHLTRPVVMHIVVDTYEEAVKDLPESKRAQITADIDALVEKSADEAGGISMKLGTSRYDVIIEERNFDKFYNSKFDILAKARKIDENVTLSIGVGRGSPDLGETNLLARQALDMALGRGGDQAVLKSGDGYEFFGGSKQGVEKSSKVRSRIKANALRDVVLQSDLVLCMGHRNSDADAVGSALGIAYAVRSLGKKAYVVVREETSLCRNIIDAIKDEESLEDIFITPERALMFATENTLLVITDTHTARMTESEELCAKCQRKAFIDHHRLMVDYIKDTVVQYHEPNASSACELVSELLQYMIPARGKMPSIVPTAILAGIMLDTKNFSEKTGVRTFEAAVYLRRLNASTADVYKFFSVPKEVYKARSEIVNRAEITNGIAVAYGDALPKDLSVAVPQAANELLSIDGVGASVVAAPVENRITISARSRGDVNVQLIMEYLGGGGHLTMAGAQLQDCTIDEAKSKIAEAIAHYSHG